MKIYDFLYFWAKRSPLRTHGRKCIVKPMESQWILKGIFNQEMKKLWNHMIMLTFHDLAWNYKEINILKDYCILSYWHVCGLQKALNSYRNTIHFHHGQQTNKFSTKILEFLIFSWNYEIILIFKKMTENHDFHRLLTLDHAGSEKHT